ncbi:tetratricopeptide repeat protein [Antarcticirhabdus aurantiaca]|uniref:Tetratricopeptide repeat protein n=1 Tax=Antarcticirhabdus aurantiaca TaxID=2606717 RepID=A0ACD4NUI9_9HYPH|nr:tetratricopeptide repeat protein [Antarcticirhabdus aurantiaca]WAJ30395.1 tetratricopeptide repeat protein [Jeongeuplla avenae]
MRLFSSPLRQLAAFAVLTLAATAAGAQEPAPPSPSPPGVIQPGEPPGGSGRSPMIVPAPDDRAPAAPETFGSGASPVVPGGAPPLDQAAEAGTKDERLDALFTELHRQPVALIAEKTASRIEQEWVHSGSATVDLLMSRAASAMAKNNNAAALDLLDQALVLDPDFAEAWNRRATLHFAMDAYGKSIVDIEQTLQREPRHFGALMGLALILERTDRKAQALDTYLRVLAIYPTLRSAQEAAGRLADELTGPTI